MPRSRPRKSARAAVQTVPNRPLNKWLAIIPAAILVAATLLTVFGGVAAAPR